MNDITKARYFLKQRGSDLQHLESFALMLSAADSHYREVKLQKARKIDQPGTWESYEADCAIDLAVLRYLKRNNQLPRNVADVFKPDITVEEKLNLASSWING